jgi:hypothetical protein
VLFLHVSTRLKTREHDGLFGDKGFTGFPSLAFTDAKGDIIARHASARDLPSLDKTAGMATAYLALRDKAAAGDPAARQHLFVADLGLGHYDFSRGSLRLAAMPDMPAALRQKAEQNLIDVQYKEISTRLRRSPSQQRTEAIKAFNAMNVEFFKAGRLPSGYQGNSVILGTMNAAFADQDIELYEAALAAYKQRHADSPRSARTIEFHAGRLARLREDR